MYTRLIRFKTGLLDIRHLPPSPYGCDAIANHKWYSAQKEIEHVVVTDEHEVTHIYRDGEYVETFLQPGMRA